MKSSHLSLFLATTLLHAATPAAFAVADVDSEPAKTPVLVMQSEVTVDGDERPALGRSFTDTLTGGLLRSGGFSVIDYMSSEVIAAEIGKIPSGRPPELSASQFGRMTGAEFVFVPRMIVEDEYQKMTIKKIRVSDGAVLAVYETEANGERSTMFRLAEELLGRIGSELNRERTEKAAAERKLRRTGEVIVEETGPAPTEEPALRDDPKTTPEPEPAEVLVEITGPAHPEVIAESPNAVNLATRKPERKMDAPPELVGTVTAVNLDYAFCIVNVNRGAQPAVDENLRILVDNPLVPVVKLRVSKIENRQVVAERVSGAPMERISPGQRVYRWESPEP